MPLCSTTYSSSGTMEVVERFHKHSLNSKEEQADTPPTINGELKIGRIESILIKFHTSIFASFRRQLTLSAHRSKGA